MRSAKLGYGKVFGVKPSGVLAAEQFGDLDGNNMADENLMKLRFVRESLHRYWSSEG